MTDYRYDAIDRLTSITYPSIGGVRAQRRVVYDDVNNIVTAYDENNNYTKNYYDGLGRLTQTQIYANSTVYSTTASTYYWNDKLKTYTDPTGNITTYTYDILGRMLTLTHPDGTYTHWNYNDQANQVTTYNEKGHATDYYYDWLNRLVAVTEHTNGQNFNSTYTYDAAGNLVQVKDSKNQITSYLYDNLNRLTRTNFPDTTYETKTYDNVGNIVSRLTQNATTILYSYDQINRLTKITYPDHSTVTYIYDKDSNRLQMIDPSSTTTYTYDPRGRLLSESRKINGQTYTLSYQYDSASRLIKLTYPDGYILNYAYDALNRIITVGNIATLRYRKNNQLATVGYGNGVQTAYSYDRLGRTTRIRTWNNTMTLLDLNYAYDSNGNPTSVNSGQETYTYDDLNRLTNATGPFGTLSYSYDQVGNRLSAIVNGTTTNYSYGSYNKLLSSGSTNYSYDYNGNTITKTTGSTSWSYAYDYENRLKQVKLNGQSVLQSIYDGNGRRIETVTSNTTIYHYQAGSWDPSYMKNLASGLVTDIIFAGAFRLGKVQDGVKYYYHLDRLGSVQLVTKSAKVQTFITKYLPYGSPYATSGAETFQYTGKMLDSSTGLYYYGYRYYDPQSGRFMTPDIGQPQYQNPQSINRYSYALNNPMVYTDPNGAMLAWYEAWCSGDYYSGMSANAAMHAWYDAIAGARSKSQHANSPPSISLGAIHTLAMAGFFASSTGQTGPSTSALRNSNGDMLWVKPGQTWQQANISFSPIDSVGNPSSSTTKTTTRTTTKLFGITPDQEFWMGAAMAGGGLFLLAKITGPLLVLNPLLGAVALGVGIGLLVGGVWLMSDSGVQLFPTCGNCPPSLQV